MTWAAWEPATRPYLEEHFAVRSGPRDDPVSQAIVQAAGTARDRLQRDSDPGP